MLRLGFAISHGGVASRGTMLHGGVASLGAMPCGGAALLGAAMHGGVASQEATLRGDAASLGTMPRGGAASLCATLRGGEASQGAVLSLGRRGMIPLASHDEGAVPYSWGVSVSCGSARVLALHSCGAEVAVVVDVAVGAGAGVANGVWRGSLCGVESSLAPRVESLRVTSGDPCALC